MKTHIRVQKKKVVPKRLNHFLFANYGKKIKAKLEHVEATTCQVQKLHFHFKRIKKK